MTIQEFKDNGYVHLKNVLDEQSCKNLTEYLKDLVNKQQTIKDEQCPLSQAIHGAEEFDKLLEALIPYFEEKSGLKLYPTYSYARIYAPDEVLKNHRDRPACEISATLTLDWEGDQWSIYMADEATKEDGQLKIGENNNNFYVKNVSEIKMEVGDAVMYRGCEKYHWRDEFKGKWQAQVFLHYVDANGPHAEWKYDKRESLGISKTIQNQFDYFDDCYMVVNAVSEGFCNKLIEEYSKPEVDKLPPEIGNIPGNVDLNIRNVQRLQLPLHAGIGATLTSIGLNVNKERWQYNITHSNQSEFLMYDVNGKYTTHVDTFHQKSDETRKLTVLVFLNDNFEGGKFYIQNSDERFYPPQTKGTVLIFPSFMPHGVEPVTKGIRYSVVNWMVGPYFK